ASVALVVFIEQTIQVNPSNHLGSGRELHYCRVGPKELVEHTTPDTDIFVRFTDSYAARLHVAFPSMILCVCTAWTRAVCHQAEQTIRGWGNPAGAGL